MVQKTTLSSASELSQMAKDTKTLATLATTSVSEEDVVETKSECASNITVLITAASLSHEIDKFDDSKALIKLGGICVISHVLMQLAKAGVTSALVIVGVDGAVIKEETRRNRQLYPDLKLDFLDLGPLWRGGHAASILAGKKYALDKADCDDILICPSDHIYDDHILRDFL
jgi:choline kinase